MYFLYFSDIFISEGIYIFFLFIFLVIEIVQIYFG